MPPTHALAPHTPRLPRIAVHLLVAVGLAFGVFFAAGAGVVRVAGPEPAAADVCGVTLCPEDPPEPDQPGQVIVRGWYYDETWGQWMPNLSGVPYGGYPDSSFELGMHFVDSRGVMADAQDVYATGTSDCTTSSFRKEGDTYRFTLQLQPGTWGYCTLGVGGRVDGQSVARQYVIQIIKWSQTLQWLNADGAVVDEPGVLVNGEPTTIGVWTNSPSNFWGLTATGQCTAVVQEDVGSTRYWVVTPTGIGTCRLEVLGIARMAGWTDATIAADVAVSTREAIASWGGWVQWTAGAAPPATLTYPGEPAVVGGGSAGGQVVLNASGACTVAYDTSYPQDPLLGRWLVTPTATGDCNLQLTALVFRIDGGLPPVLNHTIPVVAYDAPNQVPVAEFSVAQPGTNAPSAVSFDASATTDADGDALTYWWDFGNGSNGEGVTGSTTYTRAGAYQVTLTVFDQMGTPVSLSKQVIVTDATPPVITRTLAATLGSDGWYTSDVDIEFTVTDLESDVTSTGGCDPTTITTDTTETLVTCTATSAGGTSSRTIVVKRDATPPTLAPTVTPNSVLLGASATVDANAGDGTSGLATVSCDEPGTTDLGPGAVTCTATDVAGNTASAIGGFTVVDVPVVLPGGGKTAEGDSGARTINIGVRLSAPSAQTVTAQWTTLQLPGGTYADGATDYVPASGVVTFAPGETTKTVPVVVNGDTLDEPDETVWVAWHSPTNAVIGGFYGLGYGKIRDDDPAPKVLPGLVTAGEGDTGPTMVDVPVSLSAPSGRTVTVEWTTVPVAGASFASPPGDYTPASGVVTFAPGETTKTVPVVVNGDTLVERDEYLVVSFRNPTNARIGGFYGLGFGVIANDD